MDEATTLGDLFDRYESLPSQDAEETKRELVDAILAAIAPRVADVAEDDERSRRLRDATTRLRMLAPGADGFDEAVLDVIDTAREVLDDATTEPVAPVHRPGGEDAARDDHVTEASEQSFPASDPPGFVADGNRPS